jgi:hypothetical protein
MACQVQDLSNNDPPFNPNLWIARERKFPSKDKNFEVHDDDDDLSDPSTIAKAKLKPAAKVGGVHQKGHKAKGKKRQYASDSDNNSKAEHGARRGHCKGSQNWAQNDTTKLLDLVQRHLPLSAKGWKSIAERFTKWAELSDRLQRDGRAIEAKYKMVRVSVPSLSHS